MVKTCIWLQKKDRKDDRIVMTPRGDYVDVEYRDGDSKGTYTFELHREDATLYICDLLLSLPKDVDPFDHIQITTPTGPSVLYNIWELSDLEMANIIQRQISRSLRGEVYYNRFA